MNKNKEITVHKKIIKQIEKQAQSGKWSRRYFLTVFGQKVLDFEFSHGYHYSHTLEDTWEKTSGLPTLF